MSKSSKRSSQSKPAKPHPDFPLFIHDWRHPNRARWAKKIKGKLHYFGRVADDPKGQVALDLWLAQKDDLLAGRTPRPQDNRLTVEDLCDQFLEHKELLVDSDELAPRTWDRYHATCTLVLKTFGKSRPVDDLRPQDFAKLRGVLAKRYGAVVLCNEIQTVRSVFRYGYEAELIDKPIRFGPGFKKPSAKTIRKTRVANGPRMFKPEDIRKLLEHATVNMRAMVLLGINAAMGNTDLALLPIKAVDLENHWLDYPRAKTAIPRRIPLWAETVKAIKAALENRGEPKDPEDKALLFIGRRGQSYVGNHKGYRVHQEFARVLKWAGIEGRSFYDLRRTFQTIGEGAHDLVAVQSVMGHAPPSSDMSAIYRQRVDDARLRNVTDHVRTWLFPEAGADADDQQEAGDDRPQLRVVG